MIGIILASIGAFFHEISTSFGKWEILHKKENLYTYGFVNMFWVLVIFIGIAIIKGNFVFDIKALPLFILFVFFEVLQVYSSLNAVVKADRSTFSFLLIGTVPLLLIIDTFLGYKISIYGLIGISIMVLGLIILFINHGINKKGIKYVLFSMVNASLTISLYKYLITHHNSVPAQQIVSSVLLLVFLLIMSLYKYKENPIKLIFKKELLVQSLSMGIGAVLLSISYAFAPASIITSAKRAFGVLWSIISGNKVFHEKHLIVKMISFVFVTTGFVFLFFN